jgi:hypothetical protein
LLFSAFIVLDVLALGRVERTRLEPLALG